MTQTEASTVDDTANEAAIAAAAESVAEEPGNTPAPEDNSDDPTSTVFRLEDVPDEHREYVERYIATARPKLTQAFQSASEQQRAATEALEMAQAFDDPESAYDVLAAQLDRYGLELDKDAFMAAAQAETAEGEPEYDWEGDPTLPDDPRIDFLVEQERRRQENDAAAAQDSRVQAMQSHVQSTLQEFASKRGVEKAEDLPESVREQVIANAAALPLTEDGLPAMGRAIEMFEAAEAAAVESYLRSKGNGGDPPPPGGGPGEKRVDMSNDKERLDYALQVASRALDGS
jgi:hypothetical protein